MKQTNTETTHPALSQYLTVYMRKIQTEYRSIIQTIEILMF